MTLLYSIKPEQQPQVCRPVFRIDISGVCVCVCDEAYWRLVECVWCSFPSMLSRVVLGLSCRHLRDSARRSPETPRELTRAQLNEHTHKEKIWLLWFPKNKKHTNTKTSGFRTAKCHFYVWWPGKTFDMVKVWHALLYKVLILSWLFNILAVFQNSARVKSDGFSQTATRMVNLSWICSDYMDCFQ